MKARIKKDVVYAASFDVVVRQIEDEIILFPYEACEDNEEDEPYFLNKTGVIIWKRLDGRRSLKNIIQDLSADFKAPVKVIEKDVMEFVNKLVKRKFLVKVSGA